MKNIYKLLHITIWIFFTIIFIITIEKLSINKRENSTVDSALNNTEMIQSNNINNTNNTVIDMFKQYSQLINNNNESDELIDCLYIEYLIIYFSNTEKNLNNDTITKIEVKLQELTNLMNLENVNDVKEMSLDAKEIAINIIEQIYNLCGLNLEHNLKGDIQQISDINGNILYANKNMTDEETLNYAIIIIILLIWSFLFTICIRIAKENQLY